MTTWRLFRWVLLRGVLSGTLLGAVFLYIGIFWGAVLGTIFGIVNGITLVLLTHICFAPLRDPRRYRWSVLLVSIASTVATSFLWASGVDASIEVTLILTIVATVTAGVFAWRLPDAAVPNIDEVHTPPANAVLFYIEK